MDASIYRMRHRDILFLCVLSLLLMGIIMVHFQEGWFVVGGGRNGMEYNFLLICALVYIMFPNGFRTRAKS